MKTLSLLIVAFAFAFSASAQTASDSTHKAMHHHHEYSQSGNMTHYVMQYGKLMMDKSGTMSAVTSDVTLANGTNSTPDGKVTWKDGKSKTLTTGEKVSSTGKIWGSKMCIK